jgi:protein-S-isoprenylcysteine O-methyltransferase Ste14
MIKIGNFLFHYRNGLFPLVYLLLFPKSAPLLPDYRLAAALGLAIALFGQMIRAVAIGLDYIIRGGKNRQVYAEKLVQGGMFAHCRNPLYVGNFLILVGVGVASNSILFIATGIPFFILAYWAIIAAEENFLRNKFGAEFDAYCARVNRIVPNLSGIGTTLEGMEFNWRRLIIKEYGTTYLWMVAMILVTLKNVWLSGQYQPGHPLVWTLWSLLALVTILYLLARYLKKARILTEQTPA